VSRIGCLPKRQVQADGTEMLKEQVTVSEAIQCFGAFDAGGDDAWNRAGDEQVGDLVGELKPCSNDGCKELTLRQASFVSEIVECHESALPSPVHPATSLANARSVSGWTSSGI
jgi:hypothetical protein